MVTWLTVVPRELGRKMTRRAQLPPAMITAGQLFVWLKLVPAAMLAIFKVALPVLVKFTD
jgi:hypothetical protein